MKGKKQSSRNKEFLRRINHFQQNLECVYVMNTVDKHREDG